MCRHLVLFAYLGLQLAFVGCSDSNGSSSSGDGRDGWGGPCAEQPPAEACAKTCSVTPECADGFHCAPDNTCTAHCTAIRGCRTGFVCSPTGRCDAVVELRTDAGAGDQGSNVCADVVVGTTRTKPTVILIVDKSGSMNAAFAGGASRWDTVRSTLLDSAKGVLPPLASGVRFGVALYTATNGGSGPAYYGVPAVGPCPRLELTPPALENLSVIEANYLPRSWTGSNVEPTDPDGFVGEDTPTGDTIAAVSKWLQDSGELPSPTNEPVVFLLATDGEPDSCEDADPNTNSSRRAARQEVIDAVTAARSPDVNQDVKTYALFVGNASSDTVRNHMKEVAEAGGGHSTFYEATTASALRGALQQIIGAQVSCKLNLNGEVSNVDRACEGTVVLGGRTLQCGTEWRALTVSQIELMGTACDELKAGKELSATFPCGAVTLH